jgi:hypothetical protein
MSVIRIKRRENPYVQIDKTALNDTRLSWKAKGLLAYMLSKTDNYQFYVSELTKHSKDGKDSTKRAIDELIKFGYMERKEKPKVKGKFVGYDYILHEEPIKVTVAEKPLRKNRCGLSAAENPQLLNNKNSNNNIRTNVPKTKEQRQKETFQQNLACVNFGPVTGKLKELTIKYLTLRQQIQPDFITVGAFQVVIKQIYKIAADPKQGKTAAMEAVKLSTEKGYKSIDYSYLINSGYEPQQTQVYSRPK